MTLGLLSSEGRTRAKHAASDDPNIVLQLDDWQTDMCARLEKAFWCASAHKFPGKFRFGVDVGEKQYAEAPNGFRIPQKDFQVRESIGTSSGSEPWLSAITLVLALATYCQYLHLSK